MTTLRRKVILLVSTIVVALALVVLPGCKQSSTKEPAKTKSPANDPTKDFD